jgi:hypothetical protein
MSPTRTVEPRDMRTSRYGGRPVFCSHAPTSQAIPAGLLV